MRDWSHQDRAIEQARAAYRKGYRKIIMRVPTGGGKTEIAGRILQSSIDGGRSGLMFAHRRNLAVQFKDSIMDRQGLQSGMIMDGYDYTPGASVYCGTKQSISARIQSGMLAGNMFHGPVNPDIIIADECHGAIDMQSQIIYNQWPNAFVIGLTGTACRPDNRSLSPWFDHIIDVVSTAELTHKGILAPVHYIEPNDIGLHALERKLTVAEREDGVKVPKIVGDPVDDWLKFAENRQTLLFADNVQHSKHLQRRFAEAGVTALHLDAHSTDEKREEAFRAMNAGEAKVLCNVGLYVEGADVPEIWCVQFACKTKSLVKWWQGVGRGLRNPEEPPHEYLIVIDGGGNKERLGRVDDHVDWSLSGKAKAWKINKRPDKNYTSVTYCESCGQCYANAMSKCPVCSADHVRRGMDVETAEGELVAKKKTKKPANKDLDAITKIHMLSALKYHYDRHNDKVSKDNAKRSELGEKNKPLWKPGWVFMKYKEIFKEPPTSEMIQTCVPEKPEKGSFGARQLMRINMAAKFYKKKKICP